MGLTRRLWFCCCWSFFLFRHMSLVGICISLGEIIFMKEFETLCQKAGSFHISVAFMLQHFLNFIGKQCNFYHVIFVIFSCLSGQVFFEFQRRNRQEKQNIISISGFASPGLTVGNTGSACLHQCNTLFACDIFCLSCSVRLCIPAIRELAVSGVTACLKKCSLWHGKDLCGEEGSRNSLREWQGKIWWPDAGRFSFPEEI